MKPIDYRNETWDQVIERMDALRKVVYRALQQHGPCTTRQLAHLMEKEDAQRENMLLRVRPRVTELYQLGLAELAFPEAEGREGIYQAVPYVVAMARFHQRQAREKSDQLSLGI